MKSDGFVRVKDLDLTAETDGRFVEGHGTIPLEKHGLEVGDEGG